MLFVVGEQTKVLGSLNNIKYPSFLPGLFQEGIYCYANFFCYANSSIVPLWKKASILSLELFDH